MRAIQYLIVSFAIALFSLWTVYSFARIGLVAAQPNSGLAVYGLVQMWSAVATPLALIGLLTKP